MKTSIILIILGCLFTNCNSNKNTDGIFVDFQKLETVKKRIQEKDKNYLPAYRVLIQNAELALKEGNFSVMDKKRIPPSGDKHDYLSMGPYWWPDSTKTDGLPYIRKDGEINPETRGDNVDRPSAGKLFENVETLGWACYFSGDKKYAEKAVELLETWFISPETKMNPNLNFAQGIPGICDGRGIGIIDWAGINKLISTIQILEANHLLAENTKTQLNTWFEDYLEWLLNSENGKDEEDELNNHGTWYDVQVIGIELMLGKTDLSKTRLEEAKTQRIAAQIEPDGSQPKELARTKSLGYSTMNLRAFLHLANLGKKVKVDLWDFKTTDGRSITAALDFLIPFVTGEKQWNHQQLGHLEEALENAKTVFVMAAEATGIEKYKEIAASVKNPENNIETLLYPPF